MSKFSDLRTGISFISIKGDVRQPHNYAMGRIPDGYARWVIASRYHSDVERILQELKAAVSFVSFPPDEAFLLKHSLNLEDYIMYHQGYFLDLVHQLKDKTCQLIKSVITTDKNYSEKHEKSVDLGKLLVDKDLLKIPHLAEHLGKWDENLSKGPISIVLKKRTFYHHFKNPLPTTTSYFQAKTHRFLLSANFQSQLSEYGKQIVEEKGKESLQSWQSDTATKMTATFNAIESNIESIAQALMSYYKFPYDATEKSSKRATQRYVGLSKLLEVPDSAYQVTAIQKPIRGILDILAIALPTALGNELSAIYINGSIPRGDFMWGLSDMNFVVITKNNSPEIKTIIHRFIDEPATILKIPVDTKILSETEFAAPDQVKLRFICRTDGLLLAGQSTLLKEKDQRISFKLAWMLNKDFKDYISVLKKTLTDPSKTFTHRDLTLLARELGKRTYRLCFSQVIGNNTRYTTSFKQMQWLNDFYYPSNHQFNSKTYQFFDAHPITTQADLLSICDNMEEKMMPLYDAIAKVVNGAE